jgi:hypothetical protein
LFRFANSQKNPLEASVLASAPFEPVFIDFKQPAKFTISRFLGSTAGGMNFPTGNGLGVAIVVENTSALEVPRGDSAFLRIHKVRLEFQAGVRHDNDLD